MEDKQNIDTSKVIADNQSFNNTAKELSEASKRLTVAYKTGNKQEIARYEQEFEELHKKTRAEASAVRVENQQLQRQTNQVWQKAGKILIITALVIIPVQILLLALLSHVAGHNQSASNRAFVRGIEFSGMGNITVAILGIISTVYARIKK